MEKSKCGPLAELPSAALRTREGSGMPFVGVDANVGTGTRQGQGVKTEVAKLKAILEITPATQQVMQPCDEL